MGLFGELAIAAVARLPYDRDVLWAAASLVPRECPEANAESLLACIARPPLPPEGTHVLAWIPRVHLAVSDAIAQLDDGWDGSARPDGGAVCWATPLYWAWCTMSHLYDNEREELVKKLRASRA